MTDITEVARACEAEGADGLSLINTLGHATEPENQAAHFAQHHRRAVRPRSVPGGPSDGVPGVSGGAHPPVGIGGVSSAEDVLEMMLAGATAVQVGSANLVDPFACRDIINALPDTMRVYNIRNLSEIIGGAH